MIGFIGVKRVLPFLIAGILMLARVEAVAQSQTVKNLVSQGNALYLQGSYDEALAKYDEAIAADANYAVAHNNRGLALIRVEQVGGAIGAIGQAIALNATEKRFRLNLAKAYLEDDNPTSGVVTLDRLIADHPDYKEAWFNRGWGHDEQGNFAAAATDYAGALAIDPTYTKAMIGLGIAKARLADADSGVWWFLRAIAATNDNNAASALNLLARRNLRTLRGEDFAFSGSASPAALADGIGNIEKQQFASAISTLDALTDAEPGSAIAHDSLSRALRLAHPADPHADDEYTTTLGLLPPVNLASIPSSAKAFIDFYPEGQTPLDSRLFPGTFDYFVNASPRVGSASIRVEAAAANQYSVNAEAAYDFDLADLVKGANVAGIPNGLKPGQDQTLDLVELLGAVSAWDLGVIKAGDFNQTNASLAIASGFFAGKESSCAAQMACSHPSVTINKSAASLLPGDQEFQISVGSDLGDSPEPVVFTVAWVSPRDSGSFTLTIDPDGDDDGLLNVDEPAHATDPWNPDTDGDEIPDGWEVAGALNPLSELDADTDADGDGIANFGEWVLLSDPRNAASPQRLFVDSANGSDTTGDGTEGNPFATIQHAVDSVTTPPMTIVAVAGTYFENVILQNRMALIGAGASGPGATVVDAQGAGRCITVPVDGRAVVQGLKVTRGNSAQGGSGIGTTGGVPRVYLHGVAAVGNTTPSSTNGAGVRVEGGSLRAARCEFRGNSTGTYGYGGGIYCNTAKVALLDSILARNASGYSGDGLYVGNGTLLMRNCTVADNDGSGVYLPTSTARIENSILWGNGDDIYPYGGGSGFTLANSCVEDADGNPGWPWGIDAGAPFNGTRAARSFDISDSQSSAIEITRTSATAGPVAFHYKVSSQASYDGLRFSVDGVEKLSLRSGETPWTLFTTDVTTGTHTFKWVYSKNSSTTTGEDSAWIDDVAFPDGATEGFETGDFSAFDWTLPSNLSADPRFVDRGKGDYRLRPDSPCVDYGAGDKASSVDFYGHTRWDSPTALNYGNGTPPYADMGYHEMHDVDGDAMTDEWEEQHFNTTARDGSGDYDDDGLTDREEFDRLTDPTDPDVDDDGLLDGDEFFADGTHGDTDGYATNPHDADSDDDGLTDFEERENATHPNNADTDDDGLPDGWEVVNSLDPLDHRDADVDDDGDRLPNYGEWAVGSNPQSPVSPAQVFVDPAGGHDIAGDGDTAFPFATIQKAVDTVTTRPLTVNVAAGVNTGTLVLPGAIAIIGAGCDGANATQLDGLGSGRVVTLDGTSRTVLKNLAVTNGSVVGSGGGIYAGVTGAVLSLDNVAVRDNRVEGNSSQGAGMYAYFATVRMVRSTLLRNNNQGVSYTPYGGGVYAYGTDLRIHDCLVAENDAPGAAGDGIYATNGRADIRNTTIANNIDQGLSLRYLSRGLVTNCILWGNGDDLYLYSNTATQITHSCIEDNDTGTAILHTDPSFIDPAMGDFRLRPGSPCIDAADGDLAPPRDLTGQIPWDDPKTTDTGVGSPTFVDMGCHEFLDVDGDDLPDGWEQDQFGDLSHDSSGDPDNDLLDNDGEFRAVSDPNNPDSDGDGLLDGDEVFADGTHGDTDGYATDPNDPDSDDDGLTDLQERQSGTNPNKPDTDDDSLPDLWEVTQSLDPLDPNDVDEDKDTDGLPNYGEWILGTGANDPAAPRRVFVDPGGGLDDPAAGSLASPYHTISFALTQNPSDPLAVHVAAGVCTGSLTLRSHVALIGAGPRTAWVPETTLDGQNLGRVVMGGSGFPIAVVGLRITGGIVDGGNDGAGLYHLGSVYLSNVDFESNTTVSGTSGNHADGAGLCVHQGALRAVRCRFLNNFGTGAYTYGGAFVCADSTATFLSCLFAGNNTVVEADAGYFYRSPSIIRNCTVVANGGQGFVFNQNNHRVENSILWGNGDEIVNYSATIALTRCDIEDTDGGTAVLHVNPQFIAGTRGMHRLRPGSSCIDAADGSLAPSLDYARRSRWDDPLVLDTGSGAPSFVDIGYSEYRDVDGDAMTDGWEEDVFGDLSHDGTADTDIDGATDKEEFDRGSDPLTPELQVVSITRLDASPTSQTTVRYAVEFSLPCTGVDTADFAASVLSGTLSGQTILSVTGSDSSYVVSVRAPNGYGIVRLDVVDNDTIQNETLGPLGGTGAGNGTVRTADPYLIDRTTPVIAAAPTSQSFFHRVEVTLSASDFAGIRRILYTTNGSDPRTAGGVAYVAPLTFTETTTLRFAAWDNAGNVSALGSATYSRIPPDADTDRDGISDIYEFTHGSNPGNSSSLPMNLDLDGNVIVDVDDAMLMYRWLTGQSPRDPDADFESLDFDGDGSTTVVDALYFYRNRAGKVAVIPVVRR